MPDFTNAFTKVFDVLRLVSRPITKPSADPIRLYDEDGATIATITAGWFTDEISQEQTFERINELHITDRAGVAFEDAVAFGFGGYRYERVRFPNPPLNNPREWTWLLKPVGLDSAQTLTVTVLQVSATQYLATATDEALEVNA